MRKAQAALEFLTTYGWAFLVILVMIGALAYFGILKPSRLLPDRCSIGPELNCIDYQISKADNTIKMRLQNNIGEAISVNSMSVSSESATSLNCQGSPSISGVWGADEIRDFTFSQCNSDAVGFVIGDKSKVVIGIKYNSVRSGAQYVHSVNGEIFSTVI